MFINIHQLGDVKRFDCGIFNRKTKWFREEFAGQWNQVEFNWISYDLLEGLKGVFFGVIAQAIERLNMLKNIQKNDPVITSGGIYGIVQQVKDTEVIIKIDESNNTKIRVAKSAIIGVEKTAPAE